MRTSQLDEHLRLEHGVLVSRPQDMERIHRELHERPDDEQGEGYRPHVHEED